MVNKAKRPSLNGRKAGYLTRIPSQDNARVALAYDTPKKGRAQMSEHELDTLPVIQASLEFAAAHISKLPPGKRAGWVTYLLESLEDRADDTEIAEYILREAQQAIEERLAEGRW